MSKDQYRFMRTIPSVSKAVAGNAAASRVRADVQQRLADEVADYIQRLSALVD